MNELNVFMRKKNSIAHKKWLKSVNKRNALVMSNRYVKTSAAYMEAYVQYRMERWGYTHPKPWKWEGTQQDLFDREYAIPWKEAREKELERVRNFVSSVYGKYSIVGRYKIGKKKYAEKQLGFIRRTKFSPLLVKLNDVPCDKIDFKAVRNAASKNHTNGRLICYIVSDPISCTGRICFAA